MSPDLITRITDDILGEVREWLSQALDRIYPIVIFDALRVKIRDADSPMVKNKTVHGALDANRDAICISPYRPTALERLQLRGQSHDRS